MKGEEIEEIRERVEQTRLTHGKAHQHIRALLTALEEAEAREKEAIEAGVVAAMDMLRDIQGVGTDKQAYDHIIRRLQDHYGGWTAQIRVGCGIARRALEREER